MFGPTHAASVRLLTRAGWDVVVPPAQGCCGALHAHGGNLEAARAAARRNIAAFEALQLDAIVINAAGCGSTLKEYGHLLAGDPAWAARAAAFAAQVRDLSEWLAGPGRDPIPYPARPSGPRVTFHDACHLAHAQRITQAPRDLVRAVAGDRYVELPESDVCCGSAGSYNLTEPAMAARLQQRKMENIRQTGAGIVVTTNPGCLLQIQAGLAAAGTGIRVLHIADFLDGALADPASPVPPPAHSLK
jgi:glycolate oxidase iron-sulfur subunit